jgi:DNA-binding NtrC family response regulator
MEGETVILLVDDEEPVLNALERTLRPDAYRILRVSDPVEALAVARDEPVSVVISDHLMPGMKGLDLLREVKGIRPEALRILLTGHADLQMAIAAINEGEVYRFFQKPWDDATLRLDVRLAVAHQRLLQEKADLVRQVREKTAIIAELEHSHPGITSVKRTPTGAIVIEDTDL